MRILNKIEQYFFPCTKEIERVKRENSEAVMDALSALRSRAGHRCVRSFMQDNPKPTK